MSLIIKRKNGIKYFDSIDSNITEDFFDYFEQDWFDKNIFTYDISTLFHPITEAISKEQKEKGQREVNKIYSKPLYQLHDYLLNKWNKPKTKEDYIQKNIEFKRYNEIIEKISKEQLSEKEAEEIIKFATGDKSDIKAYNSVEIGTQINKKTEIPYLLVSPRISNYLNGFIFNDKIDVKKLFNFAILHEYGHCFEYLKEYIEKGSSKLICTLKETDRSKVIDSEGKANAYGLKNMYRKDRREMLKNSKMDLSNQITKEYVSGTRKYFNY